jgi:hypothetical protein
MKARRESSGFFLWLPPVAAIAFLVLGVMPAVDVCSVLSGGVTVFSFSCAFAFDFVLRHLAMSCQSGSCCPLARRFCFVCIHVFAVDAA